MDTCALVAGFRGQNRRYGNRFSTYIIVGERGSGIIGINGAAARLVQVGDKVIVMNYGILEDAEVENHKPCIVVLNDNNKIESIL